MKKFLKWFLISLAVLFIGFVLLLIFIPEDEVAESEPETEYVEEADGDFGDLLDGEGEETESAENGEF